MIDIYITLCSSSHPVGEIQCRPRSRWETRSNNKTRTGRSTDIPAWKLYAVRVRCRIDRSLDHGATPMGEQSHLDRHEWWMTGGEGVQNHHGLQRQRIQFQRHPIVIGTGHAPSRKTRAPTTNPRRCRSVKIGEMPHQRGLRLDGRLSSQGTLGDIYSRSI
jgi:hypothetical protein